MRPEVLAHAMGNALPDARYVELAPAFTSAMVAAGATTELRAAMWCAQLGHESIGLRYMEELADGSAYEGRADLGNTQPGDGKRFKGRGPIQVTGRSNYRACSAWAFSRALAPSPTFFVDNPAAMATGFVGAVWYWIAARPQLNALSDAGDIEGATRAINGGINGLDARRARWNRCRAIGKDLLDSTRSITAPEDDVAWTAAEGAPPIPDFYPGAKGPLPDPAMALAWAAANAGIAVDRGEDAVRGIAVLAESMRTMNETLNGIARLISVTGSAAAPDVPAQAPAAIHYPTLVGEMLAQLGLTPHQAAPEGTP